MARTLKVYVQQMITDLHEHGLSNRQIAKRLGIDRNTVNRYVQAYGEARNSNAANPPTGSSGIPEVKLEPLEGGDSGSITECRILPAGPEAGDAVNAANPPTGSRSGPASLCEPFSHKIEEWLELGLSAQRIFQDLQAETGFAWSYDSVKRFVRRLEEKHEMPFRRMETPPGQQAQVDFGTGAWVLDEHGKRRRSHVFRIVLSNSRKGYSEAVFHQTTESFIRALENAFRYFGGVPKELVIDNLKAAVTKADWFDPELNRKVHDFCRYYGTVMLPTKPYTPRHKGKVERGVGYVQDNALKGRVFPSLAEENRYLRHWESHVADTRIHGTTQRQVRAAFELEKPMLLELPDHFFPVFEEGIRKVSMDGHIQVAKAYYSVPAEFIRHEVLVRWNSRSVRIFEQRRNQQIAIHARSEPGRFNTNSAHIPPEKRHGLERGPKWIMKQVTYIGENASTWANNMLKNRGVQGYRTLQGLLQLAGRHSADDINRACGQAVELEAYYLRHIRELLKQPQNQPTLDLTHQHEQIRNLSFYQNLIPGN